MSDVKVLVPEGKTMTDLTLGELDAASFHLKADVGDCLSGAVPGKRYAATIELLYRWAKRDDPRAKREDFRDYDTDMATTALRMDQTPVDVDGRPDPTEADSESGSSGSP